MTGSSLVTLQKDAEGRIFSLRGQPVILDSDLAAFYGVKTGNLNQRTRENAARFPEDFCFRLTVKEVEVLRYENRISKAGRGGRRSLPWVYTFKGAMNASGILKSPKAAEVAVAIPRAFEKMALQLQASEALVERVRRLEYDTITRAEFEKLKKDIRRSFSHLGDAVDDIEKRLPSELEP